MCFLFCQFFAYHLEKYRNVDSNACIIHYPQYNNILKLVDLNEKTFQTLLENKKIRKILGSENAHDEQMFKHSKRISKWTKKGSSS